MHINDWREIPGFPGYDVSYLGEIRSWRCATGRRKKPKLLKPYVKPSGSTIRLRLNGKNCDMSVMRIVAAAWLKMPPGMHPYHKNRDVHDDCAANIGFAPPGKVRKTPPNRKAVEMYAPSGEIVDAYPSGSAAARKNGLSQSDIWRRCNGRIKKPFALTGYSFKYSE